MKWFGNDSDGFTKADLEKVSLVILFWTTVIINCYMYIVNHVADGSFVSLTTFVGALMVGRKGLSYWKPEQYYYNNYTGSDNDEI